TFPPPKKQAATASALRRTAGLLSPLPCRAFEASILLAASEIELDGGPIGRGECPLWVHAATGTNLKLAVPLARLVSVASSGNADCVSLGIKNQTGVLYPPTHCLQDGKRNPCIVAEEGGKSSWHSAHSPE